MSFLRVKFAIESTQQACTHTFASTNEATTRCIFDEVPGEKA